MNNRTEVLVAVELPDELCGPYLQHLRDFDIAHLTARLEFGISTRKDGDVISPPSLPPGH